MAEAKLYYLQWTKWTKLSVIETVNGNLYNEE